MKGIPSIEPFKKRVKDKLRNTHTVYKMLAEFDTNTIFRNFCMHWKDGQFTSDEIEEIFKSWIDIETLLYCTNCRGYVMYDNSSQNISCRCGNLNLKDEKYYE